MKKTSSEKMAERNKKANQKRRRDQLIIGDLRLQVRDGKMTAAEALLSLTKKRDK